MNLAISIGKPRPSSNTEDQEPGPSGLRLDHDHAVETPDMNAMLKGTIASKPGPGERGRRQARGERKTSLGEIEIFAEVVSGGSMTAAARRLGLAVTVVSKRVQRLEEKLEVRLIERTTRRLALTEAGDAFYRRIIRVLEAFDEAVDCTSEVSNSLTGVLRVTAPTTFGRMHLAPHLPRFLEAHPDLEFDLDLSDDYIDITGRGFHLALRVGELADSSLVARKLAPMRRVLCAAPSYLARCGAPQDIDELGRHSLLAPQNESSWLLEGPGGSVEVDVRGRLRTDSIEVIRAAVIGGAGIALRPTWDIGQELATGTLRRVLPDCLSADRGGLFAVYPSKDMMPRKVRALLDFLVALYGPRPYWDEPLADRSDHIAGVSGGDNGELIEVRGLWRANRGHSRDSLGRSTSQGLIS